MTYLSFLLSILFEQGVPSKLTVKSLKNDMNISKFILVSFAEEQKNILLPAEPLFLLENPQIQGLSSPHLDRQLKLNSFITILGH
jgi:hypothetical protein